MDALLLDLRYALRKLIRAPVFTAVAVVSLALGIGANTAIFSVVNAVLLRDLPLEAPEELVDVYVRVPGFSAAPLSYPDVEDVDAATDEVFAGVAAVRLGLAQVDVDDGVEMVPTELVTGNYFTLLGVPAAVGRTLLPSDDVTEGGHPVVALGYDYWQSAHGGDPGAVGSEIRIGGRPYTVVGVVSDDYTGNLRGLEPGLFVPSMMVNVLDGGGSSDLEARGNQAWFTKARLTPGATTVQARGVLDRIAADLRAEHPRQWQSDKSFRLVPTADVVINPMMDRVLVPAFGLLLVVVGLVLLIACANLASFLLARASDRRREIAVRLAMGARRWTLIRQLLTETVVLAVLGGVAGLALARALLDALLRADLPLPLPVSLDLSLDPLVLAYTAAISVGAGVVFGLAPALQATDPDVAPTLKNETVGGGRRGRIDLRDLLVTGQVALSLVLLVGAGLLLRSLLARQDVDPGFGDTPAALVTLQVPADGYSGDEEGRLFFQRLEERLEALPEIGEVAYASNIHLNTLSTQAVNVRVEGVEPPAGRDFFSIDVADVDGDFFEVVGLDLLEGRVFGPGDGPDTDAVVVNRAMAELFWPGASAVGRTLYERDEERTVIGVVETAKIRTLGEDPRPFLYTGGDHSIDRFATLIATTRTGDAEAAVATAVRAARALEPRVLIYESRTLERHLAVMLLPHDLSATAASVFALLALALASIGLYGVVSYAVARRSREVGIRMSLGAEAGDVVRMLMMGGLRLVAAGLVVGLLLAALFAQLLERFLFGVGAGDAATFLGGPALLLLVSVLAAWVPARRATRVDPVRALKAD